MPYIQVDVDLGEIDFDDLLEECSSRMKSEAPYPKRENVLILKLADAIRMGLKGTGVIPNYPTSLAMK